MSLLDQYAGTEIGADVEIGARKPRVVSKVSGNIQRVFAGVPKVAIAAGGSLDVPCNVSEPFRPERIVLGDAALVLDVNNLRIGTKSLNVSSNPIPGNSFKPEAVGTHVVGYTAQAGVGFVISFSNPTSASVTTSGAAFGLALN